MRCARQHWLQTKCPAGPQNKRAGFQERRLQPAFADHNRVEGWMNADLQFLDEWIPDKIDPGTVFVLEIQEKLGLAQIL